jgi:hypothetical protein
MKRILLLSCLSLSLMACGHQLSSGTPAVPAPASSSSVATLGPLTITTGKTVSTVETTKVSAFSWTDNRGYSATNNIYPGQPRTIPSGSDYGLSVQLATPK